MCSTPPPIITSWTPEAIIAAGVVDRLLGGAALAVDRGGRVSIGKPASPGVAADVQGLLAELLDAAGDHVFDEAWSIPPARRRSCTHGPEGSKDACPL